MNRIARHKARVWILAGIFTLFNIGVPVVIAACPMMQEKLSSHSCCAENQEPVDVSLSSMTALSCCMTTIAAEPNRTEFLQTKEQNNLVFKSLFVVSSIPVHEVFIPQLSVTRSASISPSVPHSKDIPIFTSSLLI